MKKLIALILLAAMALTLASCGASKEKKTSAATEQTTAPKDRIDIDLTEMSSTMVYSKVFNMVTTPKDYKGQIVKMRGSFSTMVDNGKRYYACIIADATACCSQGIEFELSDSSLKYPADYPKEDQEITVVGRFDSYKLDVYTYCVLRDAKML